MGIENELTLIFFLTNHLKIQTLLMPSRKNLRKNLLWKKSAKPRFGIFCFIDEVKIDIVRHPHPLIRTSQNIENAKVRKYLL